MKIMDRFFAALSWFASPYGPLLASFTQQDFGTADGQSVGLYTLKNAHGMSVSITNYGGTMVSRSSPPRN